MIASCSSQIASGCVLRLDLCGIDLCKRERFLKRGHIGARHGGVLAREYSRRPAR